jgi:hypothetical protein
VIETIPAAVRPAGEGERVMKNFSLIGAALVFLALVTPAMAAQHSYHYRNGRDLPVVDGRDLPVVDATHFGYGSGRCDYHSGYGGLYEDGLYPGNVCNDGGNHLID